MMTDKRYQLRQEDLDYPIYSDLVDTEDNDKVICTFNNDSGTNKMVVLLNEQDKRIKELEGENEHLKYINNIYNDLGILPFSSAKAVCDELNKQDKRIKELEEENASMKGRIINAIVKSNQVECNCSPCVCEEYVNEELKKW